MADIWILKSSYEINSSESMRGFGEIILVQMLLFRRETTLSKATIFLLRLSFLRYDRANMEVVLKRKEGDFDSRLRAWRRKAMSGWCFLNLGDTLPGLSL